MHEKQQSLEQWGQSLASFSFSMHMKQRKTSAKLCKKNITGPCQYKQLLIEKKALLLVNLHQLWTHNDRTTKHFSDKFVTSKHKELWRWKQYWGQAPIFPFVRMKHLEDNAVIFITINC